LGIFFLSVISIIFETTTKDVFHWGCKNE
jgi:hypothetical protein